MMFSILEDLALDFIIMSWRLAFEARKKKSIPIHISLR